MTILIFVIVTFFNCDRVVQFGAHSMYHEGALIQKRSFLVICTTYFKIWFSCQLKKSKKTFNTTLFIRRSVQMTWTRHKFQMWFPYLDIIRGLRKNVFLDTLYSNTSNFFNTFDIKHQTDFYMPIFFPGTDCPWVSERCYR